MTRRTIFSAIAASLAALFERTAQADPFEAEYEKAMRFIEFDQWPADIKMYREKIGRPTLVFNRVLSIFRDEAVDRKLFRGSREWKDLAVRVYREKADAQRLYNYYRNAEIELRQQQDVPFLRQAFATIPAELEKLELELSA